jgi:transcriptional regulator with XRE-family HTH domain
MAKTMADTLGISYRNYQRYERGEMDTPYSKLLILADFFNVSIDYLVGRTDNPSRL